MRRRADGSSVALEHADGMIFPWNTDSHKCERHTGKGRWKMPRKRKTFPEAFKGELVALYEAGEETIAELEREYEVGWVNLHIRSTAASLEITA